MDNKFSAMVFLITLITGVIGYMLKSWHNKIDGRITALEQEIKILPAVDAKLSMLIDMVKDKK